MMILYTDANNNKMIDFKTIQDIMNMKKTTLHRELKSLDLVKPIKYKNLYLFRVEVLYTLMKNKLIIRLINGK
jgi:hypothetical protein